jgi:SEC-C motif
MPVNEATERLRSAGRNDDCPCGSGKKYKKCHLRADEEAASKALSESNAVKAKAAEAEAAAEEAGHEGHGHGPGEHPKAQAGAPGQVSGMPKGPRSHKPVNTPRKAV